MKKILMLGGAMHQIPVIKQAKDMGHYVITCDYLPNNPGHKYADEYHNISVIELAPVLTLAKERNVDAVIAYAMDSAAPTAAYVAERLDLPGNPYESVRLCTQKDSFRRFLKEHGFNTPRACGYSNYEEAYRDMEKYRYPVMVKPVDSSGSRGVVKVYNKDELKNAVDEALSYSRNKRFIVEEFIKKKGYQVSGDGFSYNGKLVFTSYGNELYSNIGGTREYVALGEFWPSELSSDMKRKVDNEIQRLITALNMRTCAYNIEVIIDENDDVYIIELTPRNGGSYIPQLIKYATGVDLVKYTILGALGEDCSDLRMTGSKGCFSNYMIMSHDAGRFVGLKFNEKFKKENLLDVYCSYIKGEEVHPYRNTTDMMGTIIFKADSVKEMIKITSNIFNYYKVVVE